MILVAVILAAAILILKFAADLYAAVVNKDLYAAANKDQYAVANKDQYAAVKEDQLAVAAATQEGAAEEDLEL